MVCVAEIRYARDQIQDRDSVVGHSSKLREISEDVLRYTSSHEIARPELCRTSLSGWPYFGGNIKCEQANLGGRFRNDELAILEIVEACRIKLTQAA